MIKKLLKIVLIIFIIITVYILYTAISIFLFSFKDEKTPSDAIIILGAETVGDKPSPVLEERLNHAYNLYRNGFGKKIICTGGIDDSNTIGLSEAEVEKMFLIEKGVPDYDILIESTSRYTLTNLKNAKSLMDANGLTSAVLVSDPLHMKRSITMSKMVGISAKSSPTQTSMYKSVKSKSLFLARETMYSVLYDFYRIYLLFGDEIKFKGSFFVLP